MNNAGDGDRLRTDKPDNRVIWSWALYDFANTIFSMNIISRYFPLWVTETHGAPELYLSVGLSISMLMVALSIPLLGAISDQTGKRIQPLILLTLLSALATAMIGGADSLVYGICLFMIANYCYQSAIVYYDGMLPEVSTGSKVAKVAGLGVSLGYVGAFIGLGSAIYISSRYGEDSIYYATAIMFILFSLPTFLWVKDRNAKHDVKINVSGAFQRVAKTFHEIKQHKNLFLFMVANLFIMDAANTVIVFMSVYARNIAGLNGASLNYFLMTSIVGAALGALVWGRVTSRVGAHKALQWVCFLWLCVFFYAASVLNEMMLWFVGPLAGMALGGVWVAGRTLLVEIAPAERIGEFFGFYYIAGKFSSIIGPMVWGIITYALAPVGGTLKDRVAVLSLACFTATGWWLLRKVRIDNTPSE